MRQKKILVPQDKFPRSYGESKTIHLKHFLLWAGLRDDVNHGTDARTWLDHNNYG